MQYNKKDKTVIYISLSICLGTFVSAYCSVCVSQIALLLQQKNGLSNQQLVYQLTIATSAFVFGNIIGPFFKMSILKSLQSFRKSLILVDLIAILLLLIQQIILDYKYLAITRLFLGICSGISAAIVPVYLKELIPKQILGKIGTFNQLLITTGVLCCYLLGFTLLEINKTDEIIWRVFMIIPVWVLLLRVICLSYIFPYDGIKYQLAQNKQLLKQYLTKVYHNPENALQYFENIQSSTKQENIALTTTKLPHNYNKKMKISLVLMIANQATGINAIILYSKQLFWNITASDYSFQKRGMIGQQIITLLAVAQVLSTLVSTLTIEKLGRKKLLLNGSALIILLLFSISFVDKLQLDYRILVTLIFAHIFAHNWSLGPVAIIYSADLLDDLTYVIFTLKFCAFLVALSSEYFIYYLGVGNMFLIYAVILTICYLYLKFNLIETKGLSKMEINALIDGKDKLKIK